MAVTSLSPVPVTVLSSAHTPGPPDVERVREERRQLALSSNRGRFRLFTEYQHMDFVEKPAFAEVVVEEALMLGRKP